MLPKPYYQDDWATITSRMNTPTGFDLSTAMHEAYKTVMTAETPLDDNRQLAKCWDARRDRWRQLICAGHTLAELQLVLKFLQHQVRQAGWNVAVLSLRNVTDVERFRERLSLASFWSRKYLKQEPPVKQVLREWRRCDEHSKPPEPRTPAQLLPVVFKDGYAQIRAAIEGAGND